MPPCFRIFRDFQVSSSTSPEIGRSEAAPQQPPANVKVGNAKPEILDIHRSAKPLIPNRARRCSWAGQNDGLFFLCQACCFGGRSGPSHVRSSKPYRNSGIPGTEPAQKDSKGFRAFCRASLLSRGQPSAVSPVRCPRTTEVPTSRLTRVSASPFGVLFMAGHVGELLRQRAGGLLFTSGALSPWLRNS